MTSHGIHSLTTNFTNTDTCTDYCKTCANCAAKRGITVEAMRAEWDKTRDEASAYGTRVHEYMEDLIRGRKPRNTPENEKERIVFELGAKFVKKIKPRLENIQPEKIICDEELGLAGTIYLFAKDPTSDQFVMIDWKTNKQIRMDNEWGDTFLSPIDTLPDCEYNLYGLQLAMYEHILKEGGFIEPNANVRKFICHFHAESGCKFHEIGDKFNPFKDLILADWKKRQDALKAMNVDIPSF